MVGCLGVFYHSKWNKRDCKTSRSIYKENTQLALRRKDVETTKEGFSTARNALENRLQQAKTNSQATEWRVCVRSEEEKKRILKSCHGEQLGVTLGGIKPQSNVSNVTHGITIGV